MAGQPQGTSNPNPHNTQKIAMLKIPYKSIKQGKGNTLHYVCPSQRCAKRNIIRITPHTTPKVGGDLICQHCSKKAVVQPLVPKVMNGVAWTKKENEDFLKDYPTMSSDGLKQKYGSHLRGKKRPLSALHHRAERFRNGQIVGLPPQPHMVRKNTNAHKDAVRKQIRKRGGVMSGHKLATQSEKLLVRKCVHKGLTYKQIGELISSNENRVAGIVRRMREKGEW